MEHVLSKIADVYTKKRRGLIHLTEGFGLSHWSYSVPKDPKQRIYDFYMLSLLGVADEDTFFSYIWNNKDPRGPFINDDQMRDLSFAIREARTKIIEYNANDLLDATYFAIATEFRHLYDANKLPDIIKGLQKDGYTIESGIFKKIQLHHQLYTWGANTSNLNADQIIANYLPANDPLKLLSIRIQDAYIDPLTGKPGIGVNHDKGYVAAYAAAKKAWPNQDVSFIKLAEHVFRNYKWASGYGGKKWGDIARGWLMLYEANQKTGIVGESQKMVAIDHIFDLEHNNDVMLNKVQRYKVDGGWGWIKEALDYKARAMVPVVDFFELVSPPMRKLIDVLKYIITGIAEDSPYAYQLYDWLAKSKVKTGVDAPKKQNIFYTAGSSQIPPAEMSLSVKAGIKTSNYITIKSTYGDKTGLILGVNKGITYVYYPSIPALKNKILIYLLVESWGYFRLESVYDCITNTSTDKYDLKNYLEYEEYQGLKRFSETSDKFAKDVQVKGIGYFKDMAAVAKDAKTTFTIPTSLKDITMDFVKEIDKQGQKTEPIIWFKHHYGIPVYATKTLLYVYVPLLPVMPFNDHLLIYRLSSQELAGLRDIESGNENFYDNMIEVKGKTQKDVVPISSIFHQYFDKLPPFVITSATLKQLQNISAGKSTETSKSGLSAPTETSNLKPKQIKIDIDKFKSIATKTTAEETKVWNTAPLYFKIVGIENDYIYCILPQYDKMMDFLFIYNLLSYKFVGLYDYVQDITFDLNEVKDLDVYDDSPLLFNSLNKNSTQTVNVVNKELAAYKSQPTGAVNISSADAAIKSILDAAKLPNTPNKTVTTGTDATNSTVVGNSGVLLKLLSTLKTTTIAHTGPAGKGGFKTLVINLWKITSGMGRYKFSGYLKIKRMHGEDTSVLYYAPNEVPAGKAVALYISKPDYGSPEYVSPSIGKAVVKDLQFEVKAGHCRIVSGVIANAVLKNRIILDGNIVLINCKLDGCSVGNEALSQLKFVNTKAVKITKPDGITPIDVSNLGTGYTGPNHKNISYSAY